MENSIGLVCTQLKLERLMLNIGYILRVLAYAASRLKALNCSWASRDES